MFLKLSLVRYLRTRCGGLGKRGVGCVAMFCLGRLFSQIVSFFFFFFFLENKIQMETTKNLTID